jgi:hypothetical protein
LARPPTIAGLFPKFSDKRQTISGRPCFGNRAKPSSATLEALQTHATGGEASGSCTDVPAVLESNKGGVVMITRFKSQFRFLLMLGALLLCLPFSARGQELQQNFQTYVELGIVLTPTNGIQTLQALNGPESGSGSPYTVPSGNILILTDFVLSPQIGGTEVPAPGTIFHVDILTDQGRMALDSSLAEPSSFHNSLASGMMVLPGQSVTASMSYGWPAAFYAFGRLQAIYNPNLPSP